MTSKSTAVYTKHEAHTGVWLLSLVIFSVSLHNPGWAPASHKHTGW